MAVKYRSFAAPRACGRIALVVLLSCCARASAQNGATQAATATSREVTDELGRRVQVPNAARHVVSLAPNLTEIVFALGEGENLAGDTDFCDYPSEATRKPHVGGTVNPNLERVASLMPDLVLATRSINRRETVAALDRVGLPVYVTDPHSVDEMIASVEHIGNALGAEKSAATVVSDLRGRLAELERRLGGSAPRRVFFVVWTDPLISIGRDTFIADALRRAGGRSVIDTAAEWPRISLEEVVRLQPEFLVFASAHGGDMRRDIAALHTRPGWRNLEALRNENVILLSDTINRPAPRMMDAVEQLARALHPEAFLSRDVPQAHSRSAIEEACACAR
jgi:iron complex transport system substrate-binding protein